MAEDALAFRILRLAKPALGVQSPLKFQLDEDMTSDSIRRTTYSTASSRGYKEPFADRAQLQTAIDACGVNGLMVLSKSFGDAYLGEVICRSPRDCMGAMWFSGTLFCRALWDTLLWETEQLIAQLRLLSRSGSFAYREQQLSPVHDSTYFACRLSCKQCDRKWCCMTIQRLLCRFWRQAAGTTSSFSMTSRSWASTA